MMYRLRRVVLFLLVTLPPVLRGGCSRSPGGDDPGGVPAGGVARAADKAVTPPAPVPAEGTVPAAPAVANEVRIKNFTFEPAELTVSVGSKVTWVNRDGVPHTATDTARRRRFDSDTLDAGGRYPHVFTRPGTYTYFCAVHPRMTGRVIVK